MTDKLLLCREPTGDQWELGRLPVPGATTLLLRWRPEAEAIDGGIPDFAARVIARAMAETAWVVFPSSAPTFSPEHDDPLLRTVRGGGARSLLRAALGEPTAITTVSTRRPEITVTLFDDAGFPWWLGVQTALLFDLDTPPPAPDHDTWLALLSDRWAAATLPLASNGLIGAIRAGVDGDVLGFAGTTAEAADAFADAIGRCARDHDVACAWVSEDQIG